MIIRSYQICWLNLQLDLHLWCPFNFLLSCWQNLHLWCNFFLLSGGHWNHDNKVTDPCQLWLAEFKTEFAPMVPISKFLLSSGNQSNDIKVTSCQLWQAKFKTEYALMVPIFKFLISGCNLNNDNTLLSVLLAEFTTALALMVPI